MAALPQIAPGKLLFSLDTASAIPITSDEAYIKGWFVPPPEGPGELRLLLGNEHIPVFTGLRRMDVARHHGNNPAFKYSGFVAHVPLGPTPAAARLLAVAGESELVLAERITVPAGTPTHDIQRSTDRARKPLISLLLPLSSLTRLSDQQQSDDFYLFCRSLESIRRQTYRNIQICLIGSTELSFRALRKFFPAEEVARVDSPRQAQGEFVVFLNEGDELDPRALEEFAAVLENDLDLAYPDECEIDFYGQRGVEIAKPDFDPEAFLCWNFIGRGIAVRRDILPDTPELEWTALKRLTQKVGAARIRHIAQPLYYRRRVNRSETLVGSRPGQVDAIRAPTDVEEGVRVEPGLFPGSFRLHRPLPEHCSIAIIVRPEDGLFQKAVLAPVLRARDVHFYTKAQDLAEDVQIFIHGPLDTVNHWFIEELASQALRADCLAATGISLDRQGRILHAGFRRNNESKLCDAFAGRRFTDKDLPVELSVVRSVDAIAKLFYAVRREHLSRIESAEFIASSGGLKLVMTPYAVATFDILGDEMLEDKKAASTEEKLAQLATEKNYLRRELERTREALTRLEATRCEELKARIRQLEAALKAEQKLQAELTNSLSWKITAPLRACLRLLRGK